MDPPAARAVVEDIGGAPANLDEDAPPDVAPEDRQEICLPAAAVTRVLARAAERAAAGSPGRPRDVDKDIRAVAQTFGSVLDELASSHPTRPRQNRHLGAEVHDQLAHQAEAARRARECQDGQSPGADGDASDGGTSAPAASAVLTEEAVRLLQSIAPGVRDQGPLALAKSLADAATLNADQLGAVALIAADMQKAWEAQGRPDRMKPVGRIARMLLLGGGGCGKTRIINLVLTALFVEFWGTNGLVKAAPSNKAARGVLGKTLHAAAKIGSSALDINSLSCPEKAQAALRCLWAPCGALIIDEAPQGAAPLYHALALRCTYGRAAPHGLAVAEYAEPAGSFGSMPVVVECGDELQLPPIPSAAGLFAELDGASTVHKAGVEIFRQKDYVYRLSTMKRFTDQTLVGLLTKMRIKGGCKLTHKEWSALKATDIAGLSTTEQQRRLEGTDTWYQSAFTWAAVAVAQVLRSKLSAQAAAATLYFVPAQNFVMNRPQNPRMTNAYIAEKIAAVPNMNATGRLPSIAMLHLGMAVRLTNTVEAPEAVTDATGRVVGIHLHPDDQLPCAATEAADSAAPATRILRKLPLAVIVQLDDAKEQYLLPAPCADHAASGADSACARCTCHPPGCIAVEPQLSRGSFKVEVDDPTPGSDRKYELRVQRRQLPLTIKAASTLHTLQGATANPGLIFHWRFPRFFSQELRWLATYVVLSRPPSLRQLLSVGLPAGLRDLIEGGPPEGILSRFDAMFAETEEHTRATADRLLAELAWAPH